jgi:hypothetical protein
MAGQLTTEVMRILDRHRQSGIALDTNLLLLWVVGSSDGTLISRHKRTKGFTIDDFGLLADLLSQGHSQLTTPNVLTETINLLMQTDGPGQSDLVHEFVRQVVHNRESYYRSSELVMVPHFPLLRLADTSLFRAAQSGRLVIRADFKLCGLITASGGSAINFNHLRSIG